MRHWGSSLLPSNSAFKNPFSFSRYLALYLLPGLRPGFTLAKVRKVPSKWNREPKTFKKLKMMSPKVLFDILPSLFRDKIQ